MAVLVRFELRSLFIWLTLGPGSRVLRSSGVYCLPIHLSIACSLFAFLPSDVSLCTGCVFLIWPWSLENSSRNTLFEKITIREICSFDRTTSSTFATHLPLWRRVPHHEHLPCASREIDLPLPGRRNRRHQARPGDSSLRIGRKEMNRRECWHIHNLITTGEQRPVLSSD